MIIVIVIKIDLMIVSEVRMAASKVVAILGKLVKTMTLMTTTTTAIMTMTLMTTMIMMMI